MQNFSERTGITPVPNLQIETINDALRTSLWNYLSEVISHGIHNWYDVLKVYYMKYFKAPIDDLPTDSYMCRAELKDRYYNSEWFEIYNFVEFTLKNIRLIAPFNNIVAADMEKEINQILETEYAGYRSLSLEIVQITSQTEMESIQTSLYTTNKYGFNGIREHFENALSLLGKKPTPDYRNSIKESISAVEGICKVLVSEKSGGIDNALKKLETKFTIHPALKKGITNLYGYASDENGIRHPILEQSDIGFSEAKYMVVSCSAFVNYVIEQAIKHNLIPAV